MTIRLFLADDHTIFRSGLRRLFADTRDIVVCGEAADGQDALARLREGGWDVALLDVNMPHKSGLDVLRALGGDKGRLPVLILSMYPEEQYAVRALQAGAAGYLAKDADEDQLLAAVRKVAQGGRYISPELAEKLVSLFDGSGGRPVHHELSGREQQIFEMIVDGRTLTEIADTLAISVKTVSTYRTRILDKLKLKTNADLVRYAMEQGIR